MTESQSWSSLRESLLSESALIGCAIHITRIENMVGVGTPDTNLCIKGKEWWMEGKHICYLPVKLTTLVKVGLREEQKSFSVRRMLCGSPCWLWCRVSYARPGTEGGIGWYLFKMNSQDIIDKLRLGMPLTEFMQHKQASSKFLVKNLFQQLLGEHLNV